MSKLKDENKMSKLKDYKVYISQTTKMKLVSLFFLILAVNSYLQYCPPSYFFDIQHCQKCQQHCICRAENTCDSCIDGYTFYKNKCIQCPQMAGVYGTCSGCCSRQTGTVLACTDCAVVPGKYSFLFSGRCILSDGCFQVDSKGFCTECRTGYYEVDNMCYKCHASCATCTDLTNCLDCANGYYWKVNHGGLCTPCPNGCATCYQSGVCSSCLQSYYKYTDHCLSCPVDCLECNDGSTCTSCSAGILVSNLCIKCDDLTYGGSTGCLSCAQNNNFIKCEKCDDRYFLDSSTGVCRLCSNYIAGAQRCRDQNTPTQCLNDMHVTLENRYYLVGLSCVQNLKKCKKIADVEGNCAVCYDGYIKTATFQCLACPFVGCKTSNSSVVSNVCTCTECNSGYYLPTGQVVCQACSTPNCAQCVNNICSKCLPNFYLSAGSCVSSVVANCLVLAASGTCQTCMDSYYLGSDNLCYLCQQNCMKCINRFSCQKCMVGYFLDFTNVCIKIPNHCYEFDTANKKCILCEHGYYLYEGFCLECTLETGTLNNCQGLCPIDYYIQDLLRTSLSFAIYTRISLAVLSFFMITLIH